MGFQNPNDSSEILYGQSGDVRDEINAYMAQVGAGHYADENDIPGGLIIRGLRRATRVINGFLEPVYANDIPVTSASSVPKLLDEIANDLATYYSLRSAAARLGGVPAEKKAEYYDAYMDPKDGMLLQIRDRKIQLTEFTASYPDDIQASRDTTRHGIFDIDSTLNHEPSPDLLDDVSDDRD